MHILVVAVIKLVVGCYGVMHNSFRMEHLYFIVRGEIPRIMKLMRKHLPQMCSLIKNGSLVFRVDQIHSWSHPVASLTFL